ncbi:MAG: hypothetical protein PF637_06315 [Spirochaetes bacterium]|jgi:hypothetical protein|nr:hypothetical protein [Spirochaetota bacterium]
MKKYSLICIILVSYMTVLMAQTVSEERKDGTKVIFDKKKGIKTFHYSDGRKQTVDLNGKTPFGIAIDDVKVQLQSEPIVVDLIFSAARSDEILTAEADKFFSALASSLKQKKYNGKSPLTVIVSYCRYGEYGFCLDKGNSITVIIMQKGKVLKQVSIDTVELRDKSKSSEFISKIAALY